MNKLLDTELKTYEAQKDTLISKAKGKFVLIRNGRVDGIFDTKQDAIRQGYERYGNVPFLVKQIVEVDIPQNFTSNLLRT